MSEAWLAWIALLLLSRHGNGLDDSCPRSLPRLISGYELARPRVSANPPIAPRLINHRLCCLGCLGHCVALAPRSRHRRRWVVPRVMRRLRNRRASGCWGRRRRRRRRRPRSRCGGGHQDLLRTQRGDGQTIATKLQFMVTKRGDRWGRLLARSVLPEPTWPLNGLSALRGPAQTRAYEPGSFRSRSYWADAALRERG